MSSKIVLSMLALFVLTACASPGELRQGRPDIDEVTAFPPERVAGCIGDKLEAWSGASRTRLSTRPTTKGYSISGDQAVGGEADTIILVDISKLDSKTHVQLFTHFIGGLGADPIKAMVRGCL